MTQQVAHKSAFDIEDFLYDAQDRIAEVLPAHIAPSKMITVALELIRGDSTLTKCLTSQEGAISIVQGVIEASQLGLLLTRNLGHAYLIPFKSGALSQNREVHLAQFIIGYRGFVHLARSGNQNIAHIFARIVFPGEPFDLDEGTVRNLYHKPNLEGSNVVTGKDGKLSGFLGAYTVVVFKDGTPPDFEWMPLQDIQRCRNSAKAKSTDTPWFQWPEEMIKKTVIRRLCKRLELSPELTAAMVRDEYREIVGSDHQPQPAPRMQMPRRRSETITVAPETPESDEPTTESAAPDCPEGHGPMLLRPSGVIKSGKLAGQKYPAFYACTKYPECKKTVNKEEWEKQQNQEPKKPVSSPNGRISKDQIADLQSLAAKAGFTHDQAMEALGRFSFESWDEISQDAYAKVRENFETWIKQRA